MIKKQTLLFLALVLIGMQVLADAPVSQSDANQPAQPARSGFDSAAQSARQKLEQSVAELNALREQIAAEKVPLSQKLSDLENELMKVRLDYQKASRLLDTRTLDLNNLRSEIKSRHEESSYLSNLLGEYTRNFESRLHIAEIQRYRKPLEEARLSAENSNLPEQEIYQAQAGLLDVSMQRLDDALGGVSFKGTAVDVSGLVQPGMFVMVGPSAIFRSDDGKNIGTVEQRIGSLEPSIIAFGNPADAQTACAIATDSTGAFPLDPTMGNAHKIEQTQETLVEHVKKGGPVMWPIFIIAGAALIVAIFKWLSMVFIRTPSQKKIYELLKAISVYDHAKAMQKTKEIGGPVGKMLATGIEHIKEPRELVEEVMFEHVLSVRLRLQRMLPFIALTSSSAPLLGLLGTVTGIMNTFTLMTVFGTGDIKTLSSGISEALITTEYGLYVAIPSLLMYAFLSRKAKSVIDEMEKAAVAVINQISKTPYQAVEDGKAAGEAVTV